MNGGLAARRLLELVGWGAVTGVGSVMLTQAAGWSGTRLVATLQALTPYGIPLVVVVAAIALWQHSNGLAVTAAAVGVGVLGLSIPLVVSPGQPTPADDAPEIRAAAINLLYSNLRVSEVADQVMDLDLDVVIFSEFTPEHRDTLLAHELADSYPFQINRDGLLAGGMAVWSRFELAEDQPTNETINRTINAIVDGPNGPMRVLAVHPPTPVFNLAGWQREITEIGDDAAASSEPTLVIGDFNASYWHPIFRDLLDRDLTDAHMANRRGWSTSWPADESIPPFVRLDHALTNDGLVSTAVEDFRVAGSDHVGLIVTLSPAAG
jgi:endonuclease/exonuclease/phosphatase (EEP) superfamily protein YafD